MEHRSPIPPLLPRAAVGVVLTIGVVIGALTLSQLGSGADDEDTETRPALPTAAGVRLFGELRAAYVAPNELAFDAMELVPGDTEDGAFSVRNPSVDVQSLPVSEAVEVTIVDCGGDGGCTEGNPLDYGTLTRRVDDDSAGPFFWLTVRDGTVVRIDEQYLP